jgi:O-antigen/teichoic acid export membrane protein
MSSASQRLILRNTVLLVGAQVIAAPLSILINVIAARKLGPTDFGQLYLATTFSSLAFLVIAWGQPGALTGMVARDRSRAGELLGSGLILRLSLLPLVLLTLVAGCALAGYDQRFLRVLSLVLLAAAFGTVAGACQDIMRGYERTDLAGATIVAAPLLGLSVVVPALLLIGNLTSFLLAQAACGAVGALVLLRLLPVLGVPRVSVNWKTCRALLRAGTPFFLFGLVVALQPNIDAVFLSKLASPEAIGWQAVAGKLSGMLIFPASALTAALYPTLSRLFAEDPAAFRASAAAALRATPAVALPIALGCALFPRIGIDLFGESSYGPAAVNLRILAIFILLLYVTMPLSATLLAAGRQRAWAAAQFGCVALSAVVDPLLIPWFQSHTGNGGLGVCISSVAGETMMVAAGLYLLPRDVLDRSIWRSYGLIAAAGTVMAAVALALSRQSPYAAAPAALIGYAACLWLTGGLDKSQLELLGSLVRRKPAAPAA